MKINLNIRRYNPEGQEGSYWQTYDLEVPEHFTVLDALMQVREEIDGTLGLRCSCRSAICGSCAMRINGHAKLACKTRITALAQEKESDPRHQQAQAKSLEIRVEPMGNMPVIKDLIADMTPFWNKVRQVTPWLQTEGPPPEREYQVPNEAMEHLTGVMACIMCGACVSDCTVLEAELKQNKPYEETFIAPAALAKAYRFVGDPRDARQKERLLKLSEPTGIYDCTHCFECVEVCPKGVAPMDRILKMREIAVEQHGIANNTGARHAKAAEFSIKASGRNYELTFYPKSVGMFNAKELIPVMPTGISLMRKAGTHLVLPHKAKKADKIKRVFKKFESKDRRRSK
ncbi:MAG TPA: succinate dehydrogenase iron-sulfur subunit [Dehalococcoidia bacterium]|nr:succinate dehydrogenase iron-sulfur subunit [Dehalococcoidia bacterium]